MFKFYKESFVSSLQSLKSRLNMKKVAAYSFVASASVAYYQGYQMRQHYLAQKRLLPPNGPKNGIEKWIEKLTDEVKEKIDEDKMTERLSQLLQSLKNKIYINNESNPQINNIKNWFRNITRHSNQKVEQLNSSSDIPLCIGCSNDNSPGEHDIAPQRLKKIKLLVMGDSLVAGVGCDRDVPALVQVLARTLSRTLGVDIEWRVASIVGGTVSDLREKLLPTLKSDFLRIIEDEQSQKQETEVIVVVICGINDIKKIFENFPYGKSPHTFQMQLQSLIEDIRSDLTVPCRVFLPAIPFSCGLSDPGWIFHTRPLQDFCTLFIYLWEYRKRIVAEEDTANIVYITSPDPVSSYATPGRGNVSADGIHPSTQGYEWWALHIAEAILSSRLTSAMSAKTD